MSSRTKTEVFRHPIRIFGPHNGHELFFKTRSGKPFPRTPEQIHPLEMLWLSDSELAHFKPSDGDWLLKYSPAARLPANQFERVLAIREKWSKR